MFRSKFVPLAALPLLWASVAMAAPAGENSCKTPPTAAERLAMHKDMCSERYGHEVGRLATLETRLGLSEKQRGPWNAWSKEMSAAASDERDACFADEPKSEEPPTALDADARMEKELGAHLKTMQAARPALKALYEALDADQKKIFDRFFAPPPHHFPFPPRDGGPKRD